MNAKKELPGSPADALERYAEEHIGDIGAVPNMRAVLAQEPREACVDLIEVLREMNAAIDAVYRAQR